MERDASTEAPPQTAPTVAERVPGTSAPAGIDGYRLLDLLGSGGMGEVLLAEDPRLGRQVALKRMRGTTPSASAIARFLREARIQARLDHAAIVPVHEIGRDHNGLPFFTMKRLTGITLAEKLRANDGEDRQRQLQLLRAFVDVCRAIELAHARGVIHRDLKPANVMLGDYGEVYVIDWGVAHAVGDAEITTDADPSSGFETRQGTVLGTPGYSSPEQMQGDPVTASTDVYALGSILFEILAGEPFDPGGTGAPGRSPAARARSRAVAPELDEICVRALGSAGDRPTAHELAGHVQQYIDGDRDLDLRRSIAGTHLRAARGHLAAGDPARRAEAMSEAGRALALTPDSSEIAELVGHLLLAPPTVLPPMLEHRLEERVLDDAERQGKLASDALLVYVMMAPFAFWAGVTSWPVVGAFLVLAVVLSLLARWHAKQRQLNIVWSVIGNAGIVALCSRFFGPFVLVPGLTAGIAIIFMVYPTFGRRRMLTIAALLAGFLLPIGLEGLGWIASTWSLEGGALITRPVAVELDGPAGLAFLVVTNVTLIVVMSLLARSFGEAQRSTRRQLEIWAWHLEQLLPSPMSR